MTTIKGIYNNGEVKLLEEVAFKKPQKILITFLEEENSSEEDEIRQLSLSQPSGFLEEYLSDEREDLYQEYAEKNFQMKLGDIVVVHFPYTNLLQNKIRPAVVVKVYRVATLQASMIISSLGRLSEKEMEQFVTAFQSLPLRK